MRTLDQIQKASIEYLDKMIRLRLNIFKEYGRIRDEAEYEHLLKHNYDYFYERMQNDKAGFYFIESNNEIVSIAAIILIEKPPVNNDDIGQEGYIFNVYTQPQFRGKGLATKIIQHIIEDFKKKNITKITLEANEKSKDVYQRIGFRSNEFHMEYRYERPRC